MCCESPIQKLANFWCKSLRVHGGGIVVKIDSSINTMKLTRIDWLLASLLLTLSGLAFQVFARLLGLEAWMAKSRFASTNSDKFHIWSLSFDPKLTSMPISAIFKLRKIFSFSEFFGRLDEERAAATPLTDQFCSNLVKASL